MKEQAKPQQYFRERVPDGRNDKCRDPETGVMKDVLDFVF